MEDIDNIMQKAIDSQLKAYHKKIEKILRKWTAKLLDLDVKKLTKKELNKQIETIEDHIFMDCVLVDLEYGVTPTRRKLKTGKIDKKQVRELINEVRELFKKEDQ